MEKFTSRDVVSNGYNNSTETPGYRRIIGCAVTLEMRTTREACGANAEVRGRAARSKIFIIV